MKLEVNGGKEELMKKEENISHGDIVAYKKKKKEKEMEENIWRRKIYFWQRRKRTEREEKANNWRKKLYRVSQKKLPFVKNAMANITVGSETSI